jgi:hypothetical protein
MLKLYRRSQEIQIQWIRKHPIQYIILNVMLLGLFFGYIEYTDRKELRKFEKENPQTD